MPIGQRIPAAEAVAVWDAVNVIHAANHHLHHVDDADNPNILAHAPRKMDVSFAK